MKVRSIDNLGDWLFGRGTSDYKTEVDAVQQMIGTKLKSFLGDCFFDLPAGIDWFNLNGSKQKLELQLAISSVILNTPDVVSANEILVSLGQNRNFLIEYDVNTVYGNATGSVEQEG